MKMTTFFEKKEKLLELLYSVLNNPVYREQVFTLAHESNVTEQHLINEFLQYNLDIDDNVGHAVYESIGNRMVLHIHNLVNGSWHKERQDTMIELIKMEKVRSIADIGFGVPSKYVKDLILKENFAELTFFDLYDSAFNFADKLLSLWDPKWSNSIFFKKTDMDTLEYVGDYDLYILQDSVEHTIDPTSYLKNLVEKSPSHSKFIVSLPIGPIFPLHYIAWESDATASKWLEDFGLNIEKSASVYTNPEVDLFAQQLPFDFHDMYTLCSKSNK